MTGSRKAFLTALEHDPNDFQANLHVGTMLRLDQEYEKALPYLDRAAAVRPGDCRRPIPDRPGQLSLAQGKTEQARNSLEALAESRLLPLRKRTSRSPPFTIVKNAKQDGDRERAIVQKLNADRQAQQPGAKLSDAEEVRQKAARQSAMRTPLALLAVLCLAALSIPAPAQQRSSFEKLSTEAGDRTGSQPRRRRHRPL